MRSVLLACFLLVSACEVPTPSERDASVDAPVTDAGVPDSGPSDAGAVHDAGSPGDGGEPADAGSAVDAGPAVDAGVPAPRARFWLWMFGDVPDMTFSDPRVRPLVRPMLFSAQPNAALNVEEEAQRAFVEIQQAVQQQRRLGRPEAYALYPQNLGVRDYAPQQPSLFNHPGDLSQPRPPAIGRCSPGRRCPAGRSTTR